MERQAIQAMMVNVTGQLPPGATLPVVKSAELHRPRPRAYSPAQVRAVAARQDARNVLATEIVHASGIRAHELLTLGRPGEQPPDDRRERSRLTGTAAEGMKFAGRDGVVYTVIGKGGLIREALLPHRLADRLEERRLDAPERVVEPGPSASRTACRARPSPGFFRPRAFPWPPAASTIIATATQDADRTRLKPGSPCWSPRTRSSARSRTTRTSPSSRSTTTAFPRCGRRWTTLPGPSARPRRENTAS